MGLGNPGPQYERTRHNAGFLVVDHVAQQFNISVTKKEFNNLSGKGRVVDKELLLTKPQTFMNLSGQAVLSLVNFYKLDLHQILIAYDDMDLPFGTIRIKLAGSSGGHKGLASILSLLGTNQIPRLRIGIGKPENIPVVDYVLTPFNETERPLLQSVIKISAEACISFITENPEIVMNRYNGPVEKINSPISKNIFKKPNG